MNLNVTIKVLNSSHNNEFNLIILAVKSEWRKVVESGD